MIKSCAYPLSFAIVLMSVSPGAQAQSAVNATGNWTVTPTGQSFATGTVKLQQEGSTIVGSYGQSGRIEGKFQPGTLQIDANWTDSRGTGWMTIIFADDGNRFSGEWGRPGSKPSGQFVAIRSVHPNVTGLYNVSVTGGPEFTSHRMSLHQLALDVVGNFGPGTQLNGTVASDANTLTGTWKGPSGNGWIKLQFADDSKTFQGTWGLAPDAEAAGQIVGSVVNTSQLWVRGLWEIASSGAAFTANVLKLQQEGQTVTGSFKGGHVQGTLPRGSLSLSGTWRDTHGTGVFVLKFASDGMHFQGTWTTKGKTSGSIIGKRVIAATPALRQ
jgi:hypothetical protein